MKGYIHDFALRERGGAIRESLRKREEEMYRRRACFRRDVGQSTSVDEVKVLDTEVCSIRKNLCQF